MCADTFRNGGVPESPLTYFKELVGWFEKYTKLKKFLVTRKAIREGEVLVDLSADDLKQRDLMGPLSFNVYESTLAGLPSLLITTFVGILFPLVPKVVEPDGALSEFQRAFLVEVSNIAPAVVKTLSPFIPPLFLLWSSFVMGWGSVESFDSNRASRRRSRDGFLYLDGAYGLLAQTLLATAIGLTFVAIQHDWGNKVLAALIAAVGVLFGVGGSLQTYLVLIKLKRLQFLLNGYEKFGGPDSRYFWAAWAINPVSLWLLSGVIFLLQIGAIDGIAFIRVWLRIHMGHLG